MIGKLKASESFEFQVLIWSKKVTELYAATEVGIDLGMS